nr:hypothetical protein [Tanacetum cinerariifolium]
TIDAKLDGFSSDFKSVCGQMPSKISVAADALVVDANKSESVSEDKMQEVMNILITMGISHSDVDKVIEFCYNDPAKGVWHMGMRFLLCMGSKWSCSFEVVCAVGAFFVDMILARGTVIFFSIVSYELIQLRLVLSTKDKENYLEHPIHAAPVAPPGQQVPPEAFAAHAAWIKGKKEFVELKVMYSKQAEQELLHTVREFHTSKQEEGQSVSSHVLKMKGYIDNLERLGQSVGQNLATVNELHPMIKLHEKMLPKKDANPALHAIRAGRVQKNQKNKPHKAAKGGHGKGKSKMGNASNNAPFASKPKTPLPPKKDNPAKDAICHQCDTGLNHEEDDQEIDEPQSDINPIRKSSRTRHALNRMCLYIDAEEHELGDLGEPTNYKAALLDPESKKWLDAMNVKMQTMKDNDQASRQWNKRFDDEIKKFGFTQNPDEPCVYLKASGSYIAILILYVDDILLMGNNIPMFQDVKSYLGRSFAMKDLGQAAYILGIKIYRDRMIPMQEKFKLSKSQGATTPAEKQRMQNIPYASANPGEEHWTAVKNILKYLRNTKDMFLVYEGNMERELRVSCYTDAGYLTDADNLKSQTRYVFVLNGGVVDWKSTKQVFLQPYLQMLNISLLLMHQRRLYGFVKFISGLGIVPPIKEPISMYCDNTGTIAIAKDDGVTKGARHFRVKAHYLRETIKLGDVKIEKIDTDDNLADPFTKALAFPKHSELTRNIGLLPASSFM